MVKIINFHKVNNSDWFDQVVCLLKKKYELINIETLKNFYIGNLKLKKAVHITVDDGDKSFYENIFPVLKKYNTPSSIFVSPKICDDQSNFWFQEIIDYNTFEFQKIISDTLQIPLKITQIYHPIIILQSLKITQIHELIIQYQKITNTPQKNCQNMTVKQVLDVQKSGLVNIGAHTLNHPILANEANDQSDYEISKSIDWLATLLGHKVDTFAFPNGQPALDFSEREMNCLKKNNISLAFSTKPENVSIFDNQLSIPRFGISYGNMYFVEAKLLLGSKWQLLKNIISKSEIEQRKKWKQIISEYAILKT